MSRSALLGAAFLAPVLFMASMSGTLADGELVKEQATSTLSMKPAGDNLYEVTTVNTRFETDFVPPSTGADDARRDDIFQLVEIEETHVNKEGVGAEGGGVSSVVGDRLDDLVGRQRIPRVVHEHTHPVRGQPS